MTTSLFPGAQDTDANLIRVVDTDPLLITQHNNLNDAIQAIESTLLAGGAGTTKYLRQDMTFAVPAGGGGGGALAVLSAQGTGAGDYSTSSSIMGDVDGTNLLVDIPASVGDVLQITFSAPVLPPGAANVGIGLLVGGSAVGDAFGFAFLTPNSWNQVSFTVLHTVISGDISAGTVAVKPQWLTSAGAAQMLNRSAFARPHLVVVNFLH